LQIIAQCKEAPNCSGDDQVGIAFQNIFLSGLLRFIVPLNDAVSSFNSKKKNLFFLKINLYMLGLKLQLSGMKKLILMLYAGK
jgi:hypothetical protein